MTEKQDKKIAIIVESLLDEIKEHGKDAVLNYVQKLDNWDNEIILINKNQQAHNANMPEISA